MIRCCYGFAGSLMLAGALVAEEAWWEYRLARKFSPRLAEIENEIQAIQTTLPDLPGVPVADQRGTGGFASLHPNSKPAGKEEFSLDVRFADAGPVDRVALVPARRYGVGGLEAQFGMPDGFSVDLIDASGAALARITNEDQLWDDPVRAGHPFVFEVSPAVEAAGLRISAHRLRLDSDISDSYVHAWAEVFAFAGQRNLALGGEVTKAGGLAPTAPWQWSNAFLTDGQTPLGLPEMPAGRHQNVGWMTYGPDKPGAVVWLEVDLGRIAWIDGLRLFPAKRPTSDLPSGFGFPRAFTVSTRESPAGPDASSPGHEKQVALANPGHNPLLVNLERHQGRYLRIEVTDLWKAFENYPAFVAFSEVEVLDGETNLALGATVRTSGGMGTVIGSGFQYWNAASLNDGFGPDGKLVPRREWLKALDQRLTLERRRHDLEIEVRDILASWRRAGWTATAGLGGVGILLLIALPVRYQLKEKRELTRVRERIAGDLHDEVGSNLGSIQMIADLAESHAGPSTELKRIQRIAAETVSAVRDIVWLLRPQGDHRIGTVEHLRETASIMLEPYEWEFTANEAAWQCEMSDEANRHLFLFFREALHNILRHSSASKVAIRTETDGRIFRLKIGDNGCGIASERLDRPATLRALRQRVEALGAGFEVDSRPGEGTRLDLSIPLDSRQKRKRRGEFRPA